MKSTQLLSVVLSMILVLGVSTGPAFAQVDDDDMDDDTSIEEHDDEREEYDDDLNEDYDDDRDEDDDK